MQPCGGNSLDQSESSRTSSSWMFAQVDGCIYCSLTKDKVVGPEQLSKWARTNRIHGSWFQVHQDGAGDKLVTFHWGKQRDNSGLFGSISTVGISGDCVQSGVNMFWAQTGSSPVLSVPSAPPCVNSRHFLMHRRAAQRSPKQLCILALPTLALPDVILSAWIPNVWT